MPLPRIGRTAAAVATVGLMGLGAAACGNSDDAEQAETAPTASVTDPGPLFDECGAMSDDEVAAAFGLGTFTTVTRNSVGCEWEIYVGGPSVSFSWYRGSPIGRERAGSDLIGRPAADVEIGGRSGFMGSYQNELGQTTLCEIGVDFGGDFVHWSVSYSNLTPVADACMVARGLAATSVERVQK
ncbi:MULTISPECIES: DUF3558 domain-containing protein [Rhodococcus]|uniref:DUF3558 domain-containing protein n=1 Tax=Rhodococcus rhodochrous TaxID=1829 RepID=A0AA46WUD2_RHORH|nr:MULTISPECIES: DUF3558 domain-containing protein [Rhodococcus]MBF4481014.1 DUF3558 domain-containing protein [Rhodococcus rhodochrous]MCB8909662.1 DUF3558 domain-containing protein [Rhodococcus rhodochrous]MDC3727730.1 DUF3558 domain-containing protein [Rhodococcus sp. Rp3]MDJ0399923.1 DUF3558 domain-containing protein [Rhodococcus rhodochrous]UZF43904.1 DUF3558 domain-containing protein [Rhodococcus rhodochrous]